MSLSEQDIDQLDAYLQNSLSEAERQAFEQKLQQMPELKTELHFQQSVKEAVVFKEATQLKSRLLKLEDELMADGSGIKPITRPGSHWAGKWGLISSMAAALALVAIAFWFLFSQPNNQELYTAYYQAYPNTEDPITRGEAGELSGFQLYEQERYEEAIEKLEQRNNETDAFYIAQSYLALGQEEQALEIFSKLSRKDFEYTDASRWYLALLLLKQDKTDEAIVQLKKLAEQPNTYQNKAIELLEELE